MGGGGRLSGGEDMNFRGGSGIIRGRGGYEIFWEGGEGGCSEGYVKYEVFELHYVGLAVLAASTVGLGYERRCCTIEPGYEGLYCIVKLGFLTKNFDKRNQI